MASYLVIDDDRVFCAALVRALVARGNQAVGGSSRRDAEAHLAARAFDRAIVDLRLGDASGLDIVRDIRASSSETLVVVLTGYGSIATAIESLRLGAHHYLCKPVGTDRIIGAFDDPAQAMAELPPEPTLARVEWEHIQRVLGDCDGNVSEAARRLGLHRRSLQRKLAKHPTRR